MIRIICLFLVGALVLGGCDRDEQTIRVQQVPKSPMPPTVPPVSAPESPKAGGEISWTVPAGWKQLPAGQMRFAAFSVSPEHPGVALTVIPLGTEAGELLANVNRWEGQLGLPPTAEPDLDKIVTHMEIAGQHADAVRLLGPESANPRMAMLAAILPQGDRVWFFKLMGPADAVLPQQSAFDSFIRSITFTTGKP